MEPHGPVSYTHLDVYKRQVLCLWGAGGRTSYAAQDTSQDISKDISQAGAASTTPETAGNTAGAIIIEYGNLRELLKQGNLSLKESIEDYEDNVNAYQEIWDITWNNHPGSDAG